MKKKKTYFRRGPWQCTLRVLFKQKFNIGLPKGLKLLNKAIYAVLECKEYPADIKNNEATFPKNSRLVCKKLIIIIVVIFVVIMIFIVIMIGWLNP